MAEPELPPPPADGPTPPPTPTPTGGTDGPPPPSPVPASPERDRPSDANNVPAPPTPAPTGGTDTTPTGGTDGPPPPAPAPGPEALGRDRFTAGVVLARAILAGPDAAGATGVGWGAVADFHATVVRPLLAGGDVPDAERPEVLRRARALDAAPVLERLAEWAMAADAPSPPTPDDVILDLIECAALLAEPAPEEALVGEPPASRPHVLVAGPDARYVVLALHGEQPPAPEGGGRRTPSPAATDGQDPTPSFSATDGAGPTSPAIGGADRAPAATGDEDRTPPVTSTSGEQPAPLAIGGADRTPPPAADRGQERTPQPADTRGAEPAPLATRGATRTPPSAGPPGRDPWHVVIPEGDLAAAEAAVRAALAPFPGREAEAGALWPYGPRVCWPPDIPFSAAGTALPMALWVLGELFGLGSPPVLSAGDFDGTEFVPVAGARLDGWSAAARAVGGELLVPVAGGWQRIPADGSPATQVGGPRTLDGAASAVWGEEWARGKRAAHAAELARMGWHFVDWRRTPPDQPIPDRRVSQVGQLERYCVDKSGYGSVAVLGGTTHSGRSAIVRQLAESLSGRRRNPWLVQVITGPTRELPDRNVALEAATHAVASAESSAEQSARRLLVFEDLQPTGDGNASEVLRHVAEGLRILVLGVLEYAENSVLDWDTDNAFVATAVVGQDARRRFVEDLAAADGALDPVPALHALDSGPRVDLRTLTRLMSGEADTAARRAERFAELWQEDRAALAFTAAVSLASGEVPEERLAAIGEADRRLFGIGPGRGPATLRLMGTDDCVALLALHSGGGLLKSGGAHRAGGRASGTAGGGGQASGTASGHPDGQASATAPASGTPDGQASSTEGGTPDGRPRGTGTRRPGSRPGATSAPPAEPRWRAVNAAVGEQLGPELTRLLRDGDPLAVERLRGVRLFHQELCRRLLRTAADDGSLEEWAATAPLLSAVRMVALIDLMSDHQAAQRVVEHLVHRTCRGTEAWSSAQLLTLMHACQQVEDLLSSATLDELVLWLIDTVDHAIAEGAGRPDERFAMLTALDRLNRDDAASVVTERALDVLSGLTVRVEDYRLVRKVDQLHRRAARRAPDSALFPVDQENPVRMLLERKPDPADGIGVLFEAMNLRLSFVDLDWNISFPAYEVALNQALRFATASELALALHGIRSPIPQFGTWLLSAWKEFPQRAREVMWRQAGATDAAALLDAVAKANVHTAFKLLSDGPHDQLARALAKRAGDAKDAKGIGQLLSSARAVEDMFRGGDGSFSGEVAEALGVDNVMALIRYDPRTSVRYHVIKGVWDAQASYRAELLDAALDVVIESVRLGRKHWGPQIALRLAQDPEMGAAALAELRSRIGQKALLAGMTSAVTAHGRALYHRLGRALHPDVPARFLQQWELAPFVEGLATSSPNAALEVCAEVARTLTDADVPDAGRLLATETGGGEQWARRLRFGRQQEAFAQVLRDLTALDRATAGDVLDRLRDTPSHIRIGGQVANVLLARLRHALFDEPTVAPSMLRAIHEVRPQLARELLADVTDDQHAVFVFRGEIQQMQNPVAQSAAARNLVRVGVTRGTPGSTWIDGVYGVRVQGMHRFSSARAVTALLRMLSAWDAGWGAAAAKAVNVARVVKRLSYGAVGDAAEAIELARAMAALDNTAGARQILDELLGRSDQGPDRLGEHLGVPALCALVDILRELAPDGVPRASRALAAAVRSLVGQPVVIDERTHWLQVGRACRMLRQVGAPVLPVGEPRVAPNVAYAPLVAWAATGLDQPGWGDDALGRAAARLAARPAVPEVTDRACLLAATGDGWAPELRAGRADWDLATAPLWLLRLLYAQEATDAALGPVLTAAEPAIRARANRDTARADWDAVRLRLMLEARSFLREGSGPGSVGEPPRGA